MVTAIKTKQVIQLSSETDVFNYLYALFNEAWSPYAPYGQVRVIDRNLIPADTADYNVGLVVFGKASVSTVALLVTQPGANYTVISTPKANLVLR